MSAASFYFDSLQQSRARREGVVDCFALPAGVRKAINRLRNRAERRKAGMALAKELPHQEDFIVLIEHTPEQSNQHAEAMSLADVAEYLHGTKHLAKRIRRQLSGH